MERLKQPKVVLALVLAMLAFIVFWQNKQPVVLKALWIARLETTLPVAMAGAFLGGVLVGALAFSRWKSRREKAKNAA
ncbi:MAG: LapA family protein [Planctomycetota bacterium]